MEENIFAVSNDILTSIRENHMSLGGASTEVYYSKGYKEKAISIQNLMNQASQFYKEKFAVNLPLFVFYSNKEDYEKYFDLHYGIPFVDEEKQPYFVFLPSEIGVISEGALSVENQVCKNIKSRLSSLGFSYESAASTYVALIGLHEIGHTIVETLGIGGVNYWLNELMATYISYCYMIKEHPHYASLYMTMSEIYFREESTFEYKELSTFDEYYHIIPSQDPANYDWYQKKLNLFAKEIYDIYGIDFVHMIKDVFKGEQWTHERTLVQLKESIPEIYQLICRFNA